MARHRSRNHGRHGTLRRERRCRHTKDITLHGLGVSDDAAAQDVAGSRHPRHTCRHGAARATLGKRHRPSVSLQARDKLQSDFIRAQEENVTAVTTPSASRHACTRVSSESPRRTPPWRVHEERVKAVHPPGVKRTTATACPEHDMAASMGPATRSRATSQTTRSPPRPKETACRTSERPGEESADAPPTTSRKHRVASQPENETAPE